MPTATAINALRPPDPTAERFSRLTKAAAGLNHTILGPCPRCGGNVVRVTLPPNREHHAQCMHCARDICCPTIILPASNTKAGNASRKM